MTEQLSTVHPNNQQYSEHAVLVMLDNFMAENHLSTPEQAKRFLDGLKFEDFEIWLNRVNGLTRGLASPSSHIADGNGEIYESNQAMGMKRVVYNPPDTSDRRGLLKKSFETAQDLEDPAVAGATLSLSINAIHPFADGNGRTSRFVFAVLSEGYDGSNESRERLCSILEETEGRNVTNLDPSKSGIDRSFVSTRLTDLLRSVQYDGLLPSTLWGAYGEAFVDDYSPDTVAAGDSISKEGRAVLDKIAGDDYLAMPAIIEQMRDDGIDFLEHFKQFPKVKRCVLDIESYFRSLSEEQIQDLYKRVQADKRRYVQFILKGMQEQGEEVIEYYIKNGLIKKKIIEEAILAT